MKVFKDSLSLCSIQNISVPYEIYNLYGYGSNVTVNVAETHQVLGKIRLCDDVNLLGCCFMDSSVILPGNRSDWRNFDLKVAKSCDGTICKEDINVVPNVKEAESVEVIVVCSHIANVRKYKQNRKACEKLTKEFLQVVWVCEGCIVLCESVPELKYHCIVVTKVIGKSRNVVIGSKTTVIVKQIISQQMFTQMQTLPKTAAFDAVFSTNNSQKVRLIT